MEKRTVYAVILSMIVLLGYNFLFPAPPQQPPKPAQTTEQQAASPETKAAPSQTAPSAAVQPAPTVDEGVKEYTVSTGLYTIVLSSRGGVVASYKLKDYKDAKGQDITLLAKPGTVPALGIGSDEKFDLSRVNFSARGSDLTLDAGHPTGSLVFTYASGPVAITRTYTFTADTYRIDVTDEVAGLPDYLVTLGTDFGISEKEGAYVHVGPVLLQGNDRISVDAKNMEDVNFIVRLFRWITGAKPKTEVAYTKNIRWIAQEDKYFFAALEPASPADEARAWLVETTPVIALKEAAGTHKYVLYAGPKENDRLAALNLGLEHIIDFGFFSIIARPIFWLMKFAHGFLGNWGWAIVFITIVTRVPFIPLINKSQESMRKMQAIQPKMAEIREKYKKDPQRMQQELSELYKKNKVNPVGGCLPILIQIPVFFALYKVLLVAIELRGAPFIFWIVDLSVKDPYYVLPILMGITMLAQQKMTPSTMDKTQAKIMLFMPVIFTFMFLNFATGLVLYWLVNNIFGIAQQFLLNRKLSRQAEAGT